MSTLNKFKQNLNLVGKESYQINFDDAVKHRFAILLRNFAIFKVNGS